MLLKGRIGVVSKQARAVSGKAGGLVGDPVPAASASLGGSSTGPGGLQETGLLLLS